MVLARLVIHSPSPVCCFHPRLIRDEAASLASPSPRQISSPSARIHRARSEDLGTDVVDATPLRAESGTGLGYARMDGEALTTSTPLALTSALTRSMSRGR
jgi:hypothetical protein